MPPPATAPGRRLLRLWPLRLELRLWPLRLELRLELRLKLELRLVLRPELRAELRLELRPEPRPLGASREGRQPPRLTSVGIAQAGTRIAPRSIARSRDTTSRCCSITLCRSSSKCGASPPVPLLGIA